MTHQKIVSLDDRADLRHCLLTLYPAVEKFHLLHGTAPPEEAGSTNPPSFLSPEKVLECCKAFMISLSIVRTSTFIPREKIHPFLQRGFTILPFATKLPLHDENNNTMPSSDETLRAYQKYERLMNRINPEHIT